MTQNLAINPEETNPQELLRQFFSAFTQYSEEERQFISSSWEYLCQKTEKVQTDSIYGLACPQRQSAAGKAFLKESQIKPGVVRHKGTSGGKVKKHLPHGAEVRCIYDHIVCNMVNRYHAGGNGTSGVDQSMKLSFRAICIDSQRRKFHNAVTHRTHSGGFYIKDRKRSQFMPLQSAYPSGNF